MIEASKIGVERCHLLSAPFCDGRIELVKNVHGAELVRVRTALLHPAIPEERDPLPLIPCQLTGQTERWKAREQDYRHM